MLCGRIPFGACRQAVPFGLPPHFRLGMPCYRQKMLALLACNHKLQRRVALLLHPLLHEFAAQYPVCVLARGLHLNVRSHYAEIRLVPIVSAVHRGPTDM
jgi:hypothetical protein